MDNLLLVAGAMFLAYAGVIILYYNIRSKDKEKRISKFMMNGVMSYRQGAYDNATTYFTMAYEIAENAKDYPNMAESIYYIGLICTENEDVENAIYFFQKASSLFVEIEDYDGRDKAINAVNSLKI